MKPSLSILTLVFALLVFFVSCGGSESNEPGSIYGVVSDKATGEPIKNAGVELLPVGLKTVTGSDGSFEFLDVSHGQYNLLVTKTGYRETKSSTITVESGKAARQDIQLEKLPAALRIVDDAKKDIYELDFGDKLDDVSRSFNIFNDSPNSFEWKITKTAEWIQSISQESGKLAAGDTQGIIVEIDRSLLREGENISQLHITAVNNGDKRLTIKATDSDVCKNNPCGDHGTCKATGVKTYECKCEEGYFSNEIECVNPCADEPCVGVENSTGKCVAKDAYSYSCKCNNTFAWNGKKCLNPCNPNPCIGLEHSTEVCEKVGDFTEYSCGCESNYEWKDSACVGKKRTFTCSELPGNAVWNSVSSYTQTWDGTGWFPPDSSTAYNEIASETECRFKCDVNYNWNSSISKCEVAIRTYNCSGKPENSSWNSVSSYTQTWNGEAWIPADTSATYNTTASTTECRYKCNTNYDWNSSTSKCIAAMRDYICTGLPENAVWNSVSSYTQTWNGEAWSPTDTTATYNTKASTAECRFKCDDTHYWYNSECTSPCDYNPCDEVPNSTGVCDAYAWNEYLCGCRKNVFSWKSSQCILTLGNICTGQTECYYGNSMVACTLINDSVNYNYYYAQDAYYAALGKCVKQSFTFDTISNNKVVVDNNTGLQWQQTIPASKCTLENAESYCNNLSYAGYSDWRLPEFKELLTIVDISKYNPATETTYFPNTYGDEFWSSSFYLDDHDWYHIWIVNFLNGAVRYDYISSDSSDSYYVRCVRGNVLEEPTFYSLTVNNDDISIDKKTGLIWQTTKQLKETWKEALSYCEDLNYAGYSDWRLPNKNELASPIKMNKTTGTYSYLDTPITATPGTMGTRFWSSSSRDTVGPWVFDMVPSMPGIQYITCRDDCDSQSNIIFPRYVLCVRN